MFYDRFDALCKSKGVSKTKAALDAGISKSLVTKWKGNGVKIPSPEVLEKLSAYFDVSISELLGENEQKEKPAISEDDRLEQVADDIRGLSDKDFEDLQRYLRFLKSSSGQ